MSNKEELTNEELQELSILSNEDGEIFDLETLITKGKNAKFPVTINYHTPDGVKIMGVQIRPLTSEEYQLCLSHSKKFKKNFVDLMLEKALFNKNGEPFKKDLIPHIPAGIALSLCDKINEISGVESNKENPQEAQEELMEDLLGF